MDSITAMATAWATEKIEQQQTTEMLETLVSKHAAVEQQLTTLTKAVRDLTGHQKIMDEELTKRIDRSSISQPSASTSPQIASVESRLSEIESTLGEFAQSLDGKCLSAASQSLVAEAQKNRAATASAIDGLKVQAAANQKLVSQVAVRCSGSRSAPRSACRRSSSRSPGMPRPR